MMQQRNFYVNFKFGEHTRSFSFINIRIMVYQNIQIAMKHSPCNYQWCYQLEITPTFSLFSLLPPHTLSALSFSLFRSLSLLLCYILAGCGRQYFLTIFCHLRHFFSFVTLIFCSNFSHNSFTHFPAFIAVNNPPPCKLLGEIICHLLSQ